MEGLKTFLKQVDEKIDFERQLSYAFFITFSRFEYALKNSNYLIGGQLNRKAEADWDQFARSNEAHFNSQSHKSLADAVNYIQQAPPKKQIVNANNALDWIDSVPAADYNGRQLEWLLLMIRRIRNNLFHGGKYPNFMVAEPSRDRELIMSSLLILNEALNLELRVRDEFFEPI
jgi:hypothetical protein